jgi:O-antigen/teichoic acid export membrane protein
MDEKAKLSDFRQSLRFTLPLLPHQVLSWLTAFADRIIMLSLVGATVTGIYSLAYQASMVLGLVFTELNRAFMPRYARLGVDADPREVVSLVRLHYTLMMVITAASILAVPVAAPLIFRGEFAGAFDYVGPLLLAQLIYASYNVPTNLLTLARGQSRQIWLASASGAIVNAILNFAFLPVIGPWAAVWATVASYGVMVAVSMILELRSGSQLRGAFNSRSTLALCGCWSGLAVAAFLPAVVNWPATIAGYILCLAVVVGLIKILRGSRGFSSSV